MTNMYSYSFIKWFLLNIQRNLKKTSAISLPYSVSALSLSFRWYYCYLNSLLKIRASWSWDLCFNIDEPYLRILNSSFHFPLFRNLLESQAIEIIKFVEWLGPLINVFHNSDDETDSLILGSFPFSTVSRIKLQEI